MIPSRQADQPAAGPQVSAVGHPEQTLFHYLGRELSLRRLLPLRRGARDQQRIRPRIGGDVGGLELGAGG